MFMPAFIIIYPYIYLHIFHPMCTRSLKTLIVYIVFFSSLPLFFQIYFFRFLVFARDYVARGTLRISLLFSFSLFRFLCFNCTYQHALSAFQIRQIYTYIYIYVRTSERERAKKRKRMAKTNNLSFLFVLIDALSFK